MRNRRSVNWYAVGIICATRVFWIGTPLAFESQHAVSELVRRWHYMRNPRVLDWDAVGI
jgi:hypothetical protein